MASLKAFKNRMRGVKSTEKIASAMKLIAGARLRRTRVHAESAHTYIVEYMRLTRVLLKELTEKDDIKKFSELSVFLDDASWRGCDVQKNLYVLVTSCRGLCGRFNSAMIRLLKDDLNKHKCANNTLFCIGKKGYDFFKKNDNNSHILDLHINDITSDIFDFEKVENISENIMNIFQEGGYNRCFIASSEFISVIRNVPEMHQLLPLLVQDMQPMDGWMHHAEQHVHKHHATRDNEESFKHSYEPDSEELAKAVMKRAVTVKIYNLLLHGLLSEHGARMTAMEGAMRNSKEMLQKLSIEYNKARQAGITRELVEIISGISCVESLS